MLDIQALGFSLWELNHRKNADKVPGPQALRDARSRARSDRNFLEMRWYRCRLERQRQDFGGGSDSCSISVPLDCLAPWSPGTAAQSHLPTIGAVHLDLEQSKVNRLLYFWGRY